MSRPEDPIADPGTALLRVAPDARRLRGRVAVVTGSASGIGRATATLFTAHGATVIGLDIDETGAELSAQLGEAYGEGAAEFFKVDIGNVAEIHKTAEVILAAHPRIDVLFNNAGILGAYAVPYEEASYELWDRIVAVNLTGVLACSKAFLPGLKQSDNGAIVINSSIAGLLGNPDAALYSASKGALIPMTHVMAYEFAQSGIRVNCIAPGGVSGGLIKKSSNADGVASPRDKLLAATPLHRMGHPLEAAYAVLFLASDEASFVNGVVLPVDGGRIALTPGTL